MQMTEDEAKCTIEAELDKKNLIQRLLPDERAILTAEMYSRFKFS
jgi:hypothetical protein